MSRWTHIIGGIRVDGIPQVTNQSIASLTKILGPISTFEDPQDSCTLPLGSEGSLQYQIIEYYGGLPWVMIPIWGDLRDFGDDADLQQVKDWWEKLITDFGLVRDAVLHIQVDGQEPVILTNKGK